MLMVRNRCVGERLVVGPESNHYDEHVGSSDLDDLNRTITKSMLGSDAVVDLNRTITMSMLDQAILDDLNRMITKSMLGSDVLLDLESNHYDEHVGSSDSMILTEPLRNRCWEPYCWT